MDHTEEVLRLVREALPDTTVYDGQPDARLEDRPDVHVIVDVHTPTASSQNVGGRIDAEMVRWQVRVIIRSGQQYGRQDAAWAARWHSKKIRDHLVQRRLRPGGGLIDHKLQTGFVDDQAMVSHSNQIEVSQYEARA